MMNTVGSLEGESANIYVPWHHNFIYMYLYLVSFYIAKLLYVFMCACIRTEMEDVCVYIHNITQSRTHKRRSIHPSIHP